MEQERSTQTIYLKDLLFAVLYQWKWLVIAAVIGGILLGGLQLLTGGSNAILDPITITPEQQLKIDQLEKNLERTNRLIEAQTIYLEESALMALDPYHSYTSGMYLCLTPLDADRDLSMTALRSLYAHLTGAEIMDELSQEFKLDVRYFRELVGISIADESTLSVTARGNTQEDAQSIVAAFETAARAFWAEQTDLNAACSSQFILYDTGAKYDSGLYDTQNSAHQKLTSLKNTAVSTETELKKHAPTELSVGKAEPILFAAVGAAAAGEVYSVYEDEMLGMTVVLVHDGGYTTRYCSLGDDVAVAAGDRVEAGQTIGYVGTSALTESSIGDHVHFSVSCNGKSIDPLEFLAD